MPLGAIAAIPGQGLDADVNDLEIVGAETVLEVVDVGENDFAEPREVILHLVQRDRGLFVVAEESVSLGGIQILHINAEEHGVAAAEILLVLRILDEGLAIDRLERVDVWVDALAHRFSCKPVEWRGDGARQA